MEKKTTKNTMSIQMAQYHDLMNDIIINNLENEIKMKDEKNNVNDDKIETAEVEPIKATECEKIQNKINIIKSKQEDVKMESLSIDELKKKVIRLKNLGNHNVKSGDHEIAVTYYTQAIEMYKLDPILYANRAMCHLNLKNYDECIEDCIEAIKLNPKYSKPYYRLTIAYENLNDIENAFKNCKILLELEPQNNQAIELYDRIKDELQLEEFENVPLSSTNENFKGLPKDVIEIETFDKPPHLRSETPLKQINIVEIIDESLDKVENKILNSDDQTDAKIQISNSETNFDVINLINLNVPKNVPEFYQTWNELTDYQKYKYLKIIEPSNINKLLGSRFDYKLLSELITVLLDYHVAYGEKIGKLLLNIANHDEVRIIAYFLCRKDREKLYELINYMQKQNDEIDSIDEIKMKFKM